ncbi:MAG: ADP-ribosylglycohydrolase family protein [Sutterella sp.]|nr:ADP-ribosylglycohydrolase family protein [Sutterella sp.]
MLSAVVGDIVGSEYEFHPVKRTDFPAFGANARFTDDTVLTLAVADALVAGGRDEDKTRRAMVESIASAGEAYPFCGFGQRFFRWLLDGDRRPYGSLGNGSAMRVSPVAWAFDTFEEVETFARISSAVTHDHPEGIRGACAVAAAIFCGRCGESKDFVRRFITERYGYDLSFRIADIRPSYRHSERAQTSVPQAIAAFLESESVEEAIRLAVSLGGDADTQAAIAASVAQAFYGEPPQKGLCSEWDRLAWERLDDPLREKLTRFEDWLRSSDGG